jgi:hypothetical protein
MTKIYLYLARRDKSQVKILSIFKGEKLLATRIPNIKDLNLPEILETKIGMSVHQNRFLWEVWIESAENSSQLKKSLIKRGYKDVPISGQPLFINDPEDPLGPIIPNFEKLSFKNETMLQKRKDY